MITTLNGADDLEPSTPTGIDWNVVINAASNFLGAIVAILIGGILAVKKFIPGLLDTAATNHGGAVVTAIEGVRAEIEKLSAAVLKLEKEFVDSRVDYARLDERVKNIEATVKSRRKADSRGDSE